ncbi:hypothetical protein M413DRAFT_443724 [Hebeloma cylindrosporum]|uniref:EthD domain-containing protein n=1 Tax=Hebeloma cylindrosporum TaxID=76867 RepID=A0A0C3CI71_HEBCY|nr:hypothetical protein M413DRAFT_443724 [Hebeloma cylindrosporum h7]
MPLGFLAVSSQPSSQLPLEEFHAWYEEEHIPLRLNHLQSFLTGARYYAVDGKDNRPGWMAMYDIDDTRTFGDESYTGLRKDRSQREASVMGRLDVLIRITGEVVGVWGAEEGETGRSTTGLKLGKPSGCVVTHNLELHGNIVEEWAEETAKEAGKVEGWVRLRVVKVLESGKTKMGAAVKLDEGDVARYFVVHEFEDEDLKATKALREQLATFAKVQVGDWRIWKLYKAYPCIAQGNVIG